MGVDFMLVEEGRTGVDFIVVEGYHGFIISGLAFGAEMVAC